MPTHEIVETYTSPGMMGTGDWVTTNTWRQKTDENGTSEEQKSETQFVPYDK